MKMIRAIGEFIMAVMLLIFAICGLLNFIPTYKYVPKHEFSISCSASSEDGLVEAFRKTKVEDKITYEKVWYDLSERSAFDDVRDLIIDYINTEVQAKN